MQLALTILAGLGALLFIISFLGYVIYGFRHHFVTGLISTLPVLNIITLPSLWDKSSRKFIVGLIGLTIFIGAWFLGADKGIKNLFSRQASSTTEEVVISSVPSSNNSQQQSSPSSSSTALVSTNKIEAAQKKSNNSTNYNEDEMLDLPAKALYIIGFDIVSVNQINTLKGRIVQITTSEDVQIEGRIKSVSPGSVILNGLFENELPLASIKQLKLMVKKAN